MVTHAKPVQEFDINEFLSQRTNNQDGQPLKKMQQNEGQDFKRIVRLVNAFFKDKFDNQNIPENEAKERQIVEYNAMMGDVEAKHMLIDEIQTYLRENNILSVKYPSMYESLAHGVFEQIFRFKEFYKWELYPESVSAIIKGKKMYFKINNVFVEQEEELDSDEMVNEIIRGFEIQNKDFKINKNNPQGELDLADGTRVTLTIPPRTQVPTIAFRRFIMTNFSFEEQVRRKTITSEDQRLMEIISGALFNTVISGAVESGKSTFLKTTYSHRPTHLVASAIEEHPELFLGRDFSRLVNEFSVRDGEFQRVYRTMLRYDHDYVIFSEVRGVEANYAIEGASRGVSGLLMTYHVTKPENIVMQLANHIVDEFPNRKNANEVRRIADTLDLGYTMENTLVNGKFEKKLKNVYEICYDYENDAAWIQYVIRYNEETNEWQYNSNLTESFYKRLKKDYKTNPEIVAEFKNLLKEREEYSPIPESEIKHPIPFKDGE